MEEQEEEGDCEEDFDLFCPLETTFIVGDTELSSASATYLEILSVLSQLSKVEKEKALLARWLVGKYWTYQRSSF